MKITVDLSFKTILRWALGFLLIWAALSKIANPQEFYGNVLGYSLPLPHFFLRLVAVSLPWLEILCGFMLLSKYRLEAALAWTIVLCAIFVVATGQAWARGLEISCGCFNLELLGFGPAEMKFFQSVGFAFFRAIALLAAACYLFRDYVRPPLAIAK